MATGVIWQTGGVVSPADVMDAGLHSWAGLTGMQPSDPLISGGLAGGSTNNDPDAGRGVIVTLPAAESAEPKVGQRSPAHDDWRDLFDPQTPAFWVWVFVLAAIGLIAFRVEARGGPAKFSAGVGSVA